MTDFERFEVYGIGVYYPKGWSVDVKKLKRDNGEVIFKSAEGPYLTVIWGPLNKVLKKHSNLDNYVEYMIQGLTKSRRIRKFEVLSREVAEINGHRAFITHMRMLVRYGGLLIKTFLGQDVWTMHLFCDDTRRFVVVYDIGGMGFEQENEKRFKKALENFTCH